MWLNLFNGNWNIFISRCFEEYKSWNVPLKLKLPYKHSAKKSPISTSRPANYPNLFEDCIMATCLRYETINNGVQAGLCLCWSRLTAGRQFRATLGQRGVQHSMHAHCNPSGPRPVSHSCNDTLIEQGLLKGSKWTFLLSYEVEFAILLRRRMQISYQPLSATDVHYNAWVMSHLTCCVFLFGHDRSSCSMRY